MLDKLKHLCFVIAFKSGWLNDTDPNIPETYIKYMRLNKLIKKTDKVIIKNQIILQYNPQVADMFIEELEAAEAAMADLIKKRDKLKKDLKEYLSIT